MRALLVYVRNGRLRFVGFTICLASLNISENILVLRTSRPRPAIPIFAGDRISVFDSFATEPLYGEQVGNAE